MIPPQLRFLRALVWLIAVPSSVLVGQITESPQTVAPGSVLVEMDGLRFSSDRSDGEKFTGVAVASTLVTAGLTNSLDVQAGVDVFLKETINVGGARDSHSGLGDLAFRMKWTVWRNEKLGAAVAVIPFVKIPSSTGGVGAESMEGGLIVPWAMNLRGGTMAGAMFRWDMRRNDDDNGYDAQWRATGFLQQQLTKALAIYGETTLLATSNGFSDSSGTIGAGGLFQLTKRVQLDYELQRGINSRASDWTHVFRVNWGW
jgi:hypothetical protein